MSQAQQLLHVAPRQTPRADDDFPTFRAIGRRLRNMPPRFRAFWKRARRVFLWLLLIGAALHIGLNIYASVQLNRELAAARGRGEPLTLTEMEPPPLPDERNAASFYKRAGAAAKISGKDEVILLGRNDTPSPGEAQTRRRILEENRTALALVRQAAAMQDCHFYVNWGNNPTAVMFPHYAMMRQLARLLMGQAQQEARDGDTEQALKDVGAIFRMSDHLSGESVLIGLLVSRAIEAIGYRTLGEVLQLTPVTPQQARAAQQSFPTSDWSKALRRAMLGERAMGLWAAETLRAGEPSALNQIAPPESGEAAPPSLPMKILIRLAMLLYSPLSKLDEIEYIRYMNRVIARSEQPLFAAKSGPAFLEDTIPWYTPLTRILAPVYNRLDIHQERAEVQRRQAIVALSLAVYHSTRGKYPDHLNAAQAVWGSTLPLDPYSQKVFGYRRDEDNFILYSVGPDGHDDGGKDYRSRPTSGIPVYDDMVWLYKKIKVA